MLKPVPKSRRRFLVYLLGTIGLWIDKKASAAGLMRGGLLTSSSGRKMESGGVGRAVRHPGKQNFPRETEKARGSTNTHSGKALINPVQPGGAPEMSFLHQKVARDSIKQVGGAARSGSGSPVLFLESRPFVVRCPPRFR